MSKVKVSKESKGDKGMSAAEKLAQLQGPDDQEKCMDWNSMIFNYGKFHNNKVN